jgi:hypothetical protein
MGWTIGVLGFDYRRGLWTFLFTIASRTALGPTQHPIQGVPRALSLGVKRPGREADHSPPSSAEVKNTWSYTSTPTYVFMAWCLAKHRDNFTLPYTQYQCLKYLVYSINSLRTSERAKLGPTLNANPSRILKQIIKRIFVKERNY